MRIEFAASPIANPAGKLKPGMFVRAEVRSKLARGGHVLDAFLAGKWVSPMHPEIVKELENNPDLLSTEAHDAPARHRSMRAVFTNKGPMLIWGLIIIACFLLGFATAFVGLMVTLPLIGHGTWHGYQETIQPEAAGEA